MNHPDMQLVDPDPHDPLVLFICELANAAGITAGIGAVPLLNERMPDHFWMVQAAVGALVTAVGLYSLESATPRLVPFVKRLPAGLRNLTAALRRLPAFMSRLWGWIRQRLARPKNAPSISEPIKPDHANSGSTALATQPPPGRILLPYLTLSIGLFILFPAVLARLLPLWETDPVGTALYFSAPAILIWGMAEIAYIYQKVAVFSRNSAMITGIVKSSLKVMSAVLIFVLAALEQVNEGHNLLLLIGTGLALGGLVVGFISEGLERRSRLDQPGSSSRIEKSVAGR
jgi:hypothetical protein